MVEADINRPSNSAPASPMKILPVEVDGRNPTHTPQAITATRGPRCRGAAAHVHEPEPVDGERSPGDGHHARRQAVEAVDQVDGVGEAMTQAAVMSGITRGEDDHPGQGILNWYMVTPRKYKMLAASTWPAILAGRTSRARRQ